MVEGEGKVKRSILVASAQLQYMYVSIHVTTFAHVQSCVITSDFEYHACIRHTYTCPPSTPCWVEMLTFVALAQPYVITEDFIYINVTIVSDEHTIMSIRIYTCT